MTVQVTQPPAAESAGTTDRWIRLPKKGYCPFCGLSRSHLFALIYLNPAFGAPGLLKSEGA